MGGTTGRVKSRACPAFARSASPGRSAVLVSGPGVALSGSGLVGVVCTGVTCTCPGAVDVGPLTVGAVRVSLLTVGAVRVGRRTVVVTGVRLACTAPGVSLFTSSAVGVASVGIVHTGRDAPGRHITREFVTGVDCDLRVASVVLAAVTATT